MQLAAIAMFVPIASSCCLAETLQGHALSVHKSALNLPTLILVLRDFIWPVTIIAVLVLVILAWILTLRRRLHKQTTFIQDRIQLEYVLEQRYRDLFENATDLVFTLGMDGKFLAANASTERTLA